MEDAIKFFGGLVLVVGGMFFAIMLGPLFCAFSGYLIGLTPIGSWISSGAGHLGIAVRQDELWTVAAFIGFVAPPFRSQLSTKAKE